MRNKELREVRRMTAGNRIFKCEAQGDVLYINARTQENARLQLFEKIGPIPDSLLSWSEVAVLPKGEEFL